MGLRALLCATFAFVVVAFALGPAASAESICFDKVYRHEDYARYDPEQKNTEKIVKICEREYAAKSTDIETAASLGAAYYYNGQHSEALNLLVMAYEAKNWFAALILSEMHLFGSGVPEDYEKFFQYVRDSNYFKENGWATYWLGKAYENGWGIPIDEPKAYLFYWKAAETSSRARVYLADLLYESDEANKEDLHRIDELLAEEVEKGYPDARTQAARRALQSAESYLQFAASVKALEELTRLDHSDADAVYFFLQLTLVPDVIDFYKSRFPEFVPDQEQGVQLLKRLVASASYIDVFYASEILGLGGAANVTAKNGTEIVTIIEQALNAFDVKKDELSTFILRADLMHEIFDRGYFGPRDPKAARNYTELAAKKGSHKHAINLGWAIFTGEESGTFEDAISFTKRAILTGDYNHRLVALNNLGTMYHSLSDYQLAEKYWIDAAGLGMASGYSWPFENLTRLFLFGAEERSINLKLALKWAKEAAKFQNRGHYLRFFKPS
jgi:TPR repeat protein